MKKTDDSKRQYIIHTLSNGLRVVAAQWPGNVSYTGALINAGSRDEGPAEEGLAHFVEHTIFKGTKHRRSRHIASRMESIGGELNAYTTKEETMVYTNAPAGYISRSLELISDLFKTSNFPAKELEKEKEVIIEEIHSYRDSPADAVYDDFEELIYANSGLAHNILGNPESVRQLSSGQARSFIDRFYTPGNIVIYCADPNNPERNIRLIEKYFGDMEFPTADLQRIIPPDVERFEETRSGDNHQANCLCGTRLFSRTDPRRHALFLLNNLLAGPCMNSRLNIEMRDRRGLVYTVESSIALLSDTGTMQIYFGCEPHMAKRCREIIHNEIDRLAQSPMKDSAFGKVRDQYCGQLILSGEHRESRAMAMAKSILFYNEIHDITTAAEKIREVTPCQMQEVAQIIATNGLSSLTLL